MKQRGRASASVALATTLAIACGTGASAAPMRVGRVSLPTVRVVQSATPATFEEGVDKRLRSAFGAHADDVSLVAHDRVTGRTVSYNADLQNCTGSIVKVMVLLALIKERRESGRGLSEGQRALAERMIRASDNDATTSLLRQAGGRQALDGLADDLGLTSTHSAGSWGRTTTTAGDQSRLMNLLVGGHRSLREEDRSYVLDLMSRVQPDQRWGVGTVPQGYTAQVKNGWVELAPHGWRINSIGHVKGGGHDYTLAMLSLDNDSMEAGVGLLDRASRVINDEFARSEGSATPSAGGASAPGRSRSTAPFFAPHPLW